MEDYSHPSSQIDPTHSEQYTAFPLTKCATNERFAKKFLNKKIFRTILPNQHFDAVSFLYENFYHNSEEFLKNLKNTYSFKNSLQIFHQHLSKKQFSKIIFMIHYGGENQATQFIMDPSQFKQTSFQLAFFNELFNKFKKSKTKSFKSNFMKEIELPLTGFFFAQSYKLANNRIMLMVTRDEFLEINKEECDELTSICDLYVLHVSNLLGIQLNQQKIESRIKLLELFPLPIQITSKNTHLKFENTPTVDLPKDSIIFEKSLKDVDLFLYPEKINLEGDYSHIEKSITHLLAELFNTLRHELSNPLFGLSLSSQMLIESEGLSEDDHLFLQEIRNTIQRAENILENMTQLFSKNNEKLSCEVFKSLKETLTLCKSETRGIFIDLNWDNQLDKNIKIPLSPVSFFQIIFNLILNASQALNTSNVAKKMIKITVSQIQNKIVIHIMDNGPGLPEIVKQNLFKPYLTTKKSGHGLGLVTAKNFIEKFKGNIFYRGTWENVGTHFELNFPQDLE